MLAKWQQVIQDRDVNALGSLLADDVVFYSPIVDLPQHGKKTTILYFSGAFKVFFNDAFQYVREFVSSHCAVIEFNAEIEGIAVNGVDMITWDDDDKIVEIKVMLRPLNSVNLVHKKMGQMLQAQQ